MSVHVQRLDGDPPFEDNPRGWWGYRVSISSREPFEYWILGADYIEIGDRYIQREAEDERLGDGRSPFECDDPHPDDYYDQVWDLVFDDLHRVGLLRAA